MSLVTWSNTEKRAARQAFDAALQAEFAEVLASFKARAKAARSVDDLWDIESALGRIRRGIDRKYDWRYSQLLDVLAQLVGEGRIQPNQLAALSEQKRAFIEQRLRR